MGAGGCGTAAVVAEAQGKAAAVQMPRHWTGVAQELQNTTMQVSTAVCYTKAMVAFIKCTLSPTIARCKGHRPRI